MDAVTIFHYDLLGTLPKLNFVEERKGLMTFLRIDTYDYFRKVFAEEYYLDDFAQTTSLVNVVDG